jgi:glycosyltransferase involved in cell wall biosynthesis
LPTSNRRAFVSQAIAYFKRQDYPSKELIVVDDGEDCIEDLVSDGPMIRYIRLKEKRPLGAKRNLACEQARGSLIFHWDDDDWMAKWRIRYQVGRLLEAKAEVCGLSRLYFYDPFTGRSWRYTYPRREMVLLAGGSLCFRKSLWEKNPFPEIDLGEDTAFLWSDLPKALFPLEDDSFYVALIHPGNTNPRRPNRQRWSPCPTDLLEAMLGEDLAFYRRLTEPAIGA